MLSTITLSKELAIQFPIIQAPMAGGATTPELIAAVSNAGGLGSLGAGYMSSTDITQTIQKIRILTDKPFAVNLFIPRKHQATSEQIQTACRHIEKSCPELNIKIKPAEKPYAPSFEQQIEAVIKQKVPVFSFIFGMLDENWIKKLKSNHTILIGTATNLSEAQILADNGVDFIVAQGSEAGGHRGSFLEAAENTLIKLADLVPPLVDQLKTPIIAAGGIMNGKGIAAALALGASGVQMGTAFLSCPEAGIHEKYKQALLSTTKDNTILTRAFSGGLARGIQNKFITRMHNDKSKITDYPIQNALTKNMRQVAKQQGQTNFMSMWAGQSAKLSRGIPAGELIKQLMHEMAKINR